MIEPSRPCSTMSGSDLGAALHRLRSELWGLIKEDRFETATSAMYAITMLEVEQQRRLSDVHRV